MYIVYLQSFYIINNLFQFVQDENLFPTGWTSQSANDSCRNILQNSTVYKACRNVIDVDSPLYMGVCMENIRVRILTLVQWFSTPTLGL